MSKKKETIKEVQEAQEEIQEESIGRPYEIRRLKDRDMWPVIKIITTVFPDDLADVFLKVASKEKRLEEIGMTVVARLVIAILKNINKIHDDLYEFLSDVSGIPAEEIEDMEFGTTPMMIWDIVHNEKNAGFFKVVSKLC